MSAHDLCALDDTVMLDRIKEIVRDYKIEVIVETGIYHGLSTVLLADMVPLVYAIDNNLGNAAAAVHSVVKVGDKHNVAFMISNSPPALRALAPYLPDNTLYILDAHWEVYWPLLDEIAEIRRGTGVIVIHDMIVPGRPDLLGYVCNGVPLNYETLQPALTAWSPTHVVEYNNRSAGTTYPVGIGYIFPK